MYEPRLRVGFDVPQPVEGEVQAQLTNLLRSCPHLRQTSPIEVLLEGRTATLRGAVASERDRILAQQLILFEPGISQVKNELTVRPADSPPPSPPPHRP
jgi:osmotically-inducible protein OsmY